MSNLRGGWGNPDHLIAGGSASNKPLAQAKKAKNDEFYTQYADIQNEINAYHEYNPDVFRGKTVLLPCDDPEWSNFTKFFAQNFQFLGLKKLISTSYAIESKNFQPPYEPTPFEKDSPLFSWGKTRIKGKIFTLEGDISHDGKIDINDLEWRYLEGDGDFRSEEIRKLRDEADIIVTNPPFSLFRDFLAWIIEADKKFVIIGSQNAITYKEVFPLLMNNRIWLGKGFQAGNAYFGVPDAREYASGVYDETTGLVKFRNCAWFTNIDHGKRHIPLRLMTMADNVKFSKHKDVRGREYRSYDNYDAIEVPYTDAIPSDYDGVMGVPISFLDRYCPEQFEIIGITKTWFGAASKTYPQQVQISRNGETSLVTKLNDGPVIKLDEKPTGTTYYMVGDEIYTQAYARILIKKINTAAQ